MPVLVLTGIVIYAHICSVGVQPVATHEKLNSHAVFSSVLMSGT